MKSVRLPAMLFAVVLLLGLEIVLLDLYHEEPRRLLVAVAMLEDGHWWVPRILGEIYLKKPPGFNWFVALLSWPFGSVSRVTGRLAAVLSWLGTGGILWGLTRHWKRRIDRLVVVGTFLFCPVVFLEKAALAELDLWFTLLLTASIAVWYERLSGGRPWQAWCLSHLPFALAVLTKGPAAHLFFYGTVLGWLVLERRIPHVKAALSGVFLGHGILGLWFVRTLTVVGAERWMDVMVREVFFRGASLSSWAYLKQLVLFPPRIVLSLAPWIFLLVFLVDRDVRDRWTEVLRSRSEARLALAGMIPLIVFWGLPMDRVRYVLPVFPWIAMSLGFLWKSVDEASWRRGGGWLVSVTGCLLVVTMVLAPWLIEVKQSLPVTQRQSGLSLLLALAAGVLTVFWVRRPADKNRFFVGGVAFMLILKAGYLVIFLPARKPEVFRNAQTVRQLTRRLQSPNRDVVFRSDIGLGLAYYLRKQGFRVQKVTGRAPTTRKAFLWVASSPGQLPSPRRDYRELRLPTGRTFYFARPARSDHSSR